MAEIISTDWHRCYDDGWQGVIVPEAFAHPAKFSYGLICRIVRHGLDAGYWKPGDLIGDTFGGIGGGGIVAAYHGLRWVGVELEPRFVEMAKQNFELHRTRWETAGDPQPQIIPGDSREFARLVGEAVGVVTSPPFLGSRSETTASRPTQHGGPCAERHGTTQAGAGYGDSPGQIGALPAGTIEGVISSPPYGGNEKSDYRVRDEDGNDRDERRGFRQGQGGFRVSEAYGDTAGQIGGMPTGDVDAVVTSPPYEGTNQNYADGWKYIDKEKLAQSSHDRDSSNRDASYGLTGGQLGNESGETYWQAMRIVYAQMHAAMKPGAVAAIVIKDYVKNKARVPLCDQTCTLLESLGFDVFERSRCWLTRTTEQAGLFGETITRTKERKSFFRRLAEKKGSPRIDWEEVILGTEASMIFVGVDPGQTGAIGAISGLDKPEFIGVWDCPLTLARKVDAQAVAAILNGIHQDAGPIELAMIEELQAFARVRDKSGRPIRLKGFDKLTENSGAWQAVFGVYGIETASVAPRIWKAATIGRGTHGDKKISLKHARLLFPTAELHLVKHHGRAEALLLADYARRLYRGQVLMGTRKKPA